MLTITPDLALDDKDLAESFVRASGPGGQNVNKVATAVQLRFDLPHSSLPDDVKGRLSYLAGSRLASDGSIVIQARRFRAQEQNRADARDRLAELIRKALVPPTKRAPTKVSRAQKARRLETKRRASRTKQLRRVNEGD